MVINEIFYIFIDFFVGVLLGGVFVIGVLLVFFFVIDVFVFVIMWFDIFLENGNIIWYKELINLYIGKVSFFINIIFINIILYDLFKNIDYVLVLKSIEVLWCLVVIELDDILFLLSVILVCYWDLGIVVVVIGVIVVFFSIS